MDLNNVIVSLKFSTSVCDIINIFGDTYKLFLADDTYSNFEAYGFRIKKTPRGRYQLICEENSKVKTYDLTKHEVINSFKLKRIDNWISVERVRLP